MLNAWASRRLQKQLHGESIVISLMAHLTCFGQYFTKLEASYRGYHCPGKEINHNLEVVLCLLVPTRKIVRLILKLLLPRMWVVLTLQSLWEVYEVQWVRGRLLLLVIQFCLYRSQLTVQLRAWEHVGSLLKRCKNFFSFQTLRLFYVQLGKIMLEFQNLSRLINLSIFSLLAVISLNVKVVLLRWNLLSSSIGPPLVRISQFTRSGANKTKF
mmetsp:Transcript_14303/g.21126  ORF Transcript_14303/g.21126 Transcript_14303/m.21126 type:complete len:213 (-) Transcript_14303:1160-1798(-)